MYISTTLHIPQDQTTTMHTNLSLVFKQSLLYLPHTEAKQNITDTRKNRQVLEMITKSTNIHTHEVPKLSSRCTYFLGELHSLGINVAK